MGIRDRKHTLIGLLRIRARAASLSQEQTEGFELLLRRARNDAEQDQVMKAFDAMLDGWKTNKDAFALVRRGFLDDLDEEPEPPILFIKP